MNTTVDNTSLWSGSFFAKLVLIVFILLALLALGITGSFINAVISYNSDDSRDLSSRTPGDDRDPGGGEVVPGENEAPSFWNFVKTMFFNDITGDPNLLISGIKTVFAVGIAFLVARKLAVRKGDVTFKAAGIELSGAQSRAIVWCVVFVLVKWL